MKKEDLNYEPFYYVEPMRFIDDPVEAIAFMFKYQDEKDEVEEFLKSCSIEDFLWVHVFIFKDDYGDGSLLSSLTTKNTHVEKNDYIEKYKNNPVYRNDIGEVFYTYNKEDQFVSLSFQLTPPLPTIHTVIVDALDGKQYTVANGRYTLESDSGIDYLEVSPSSFTLKANMDKAIRY